jgi:hypothetical protein
MKTISLLLITALAFTSCAKKVSFLPSSTVPAASGSVKLKKDNNNNYKVDLNVRDLPEADDLHPPRNNYTVWMETADNRALNIGSLKTSKGLFSKTRKGELKTVASFKPVRLFITAEESSSPQIPGAKPILSTSLFKVK